MTKAVQLVYCLIDGIFTLSEAFSRVRKVRAPRNSNAKPAAAYLPVGTPMLDRFWARCRTRRDIQTLWIERWTRGSDPRLVKTQLYRYPVKGDAMASKKVRCATAIQQVLSKKKSDCISPVHIASNNDCNEIYFEQHFVLSTCFLFSRYSAVNTLRTGLLICLNARSRGLTFRHRASCI